MVKSISFFKITRYAVVLLLLTGSISAQSLWLQYSHKPAFSMELYKPRYDAPVKTNLLNMTTFLTAYVPTSNDFSLIFELPYTNYDFSGSGGEGSVGNPFIGFEYENPNRTFSSVFGFRLPITSESKYYPLYLGMITEPDRAEAFTIKRLSFYGQFSFINNYTGGNSLRLGIGPLLEIPVVSSGNSYGPTTELYLRYYTQFWINAEKLSLGLGVSGLLWVTSDNFDFETNSYHHFGFALSYKTGILKPGLHLIIPLDDNFTYIKEYVYGFSLTFEFDDSFNSFR